MFLAEAWAQAEHEVDSFEFGEPVIQRGGQLALVGRGDGDGAGGAELFGGQGAVAVDGAVAQQ